jgi:hypothetical protein
MTACADVVVAAASAARPTTMSEDYDEDRGTNISYLLIIPMLVLSIFFGARVYHKGHFPGVQIM